jgi:methionyl-tRNA synthetase
LHEYLEDFKGKEDVLRYVLCANAPETKDNDFTWRDFQARNNNELVAILGNFVNRALVLTHKYFNGVVPAKAELTDYDKEVLAEIPVIKQKIEKNIELYKFREALKELMNLARLGNKYLADTEPWKLIKTDEERVKTILNISLQISASLSALMEPFIPFSAEKLKGFLNLSDISWDGVGDSDIIATGHQINKASLLFEKIDDKEIEAQLQKLEDTKKANLADSYTPAAQKENVSFDDFMKMDIRTATILSAEKVAKTKKLLKLEVDTGVDKRTVVSGIAEYYKPEDIIGKQVSILINLEPRKIKGIESQGMILMAEDADGTLQFISPTNEIKNGSEIR